MVLEIGGMDVVADGGIDAVLEELCAYIKELKQSYFSEAGKPGADWQPLKATTVKRKKQNNQLFNIEYGNLKNSIEVTAEIIFGELIIKCTATHHNGDEAIDQLIYEYGRDFLNFTEDEAALIVNKLNVLLEEHSHA